MKHLLEPLARVPGVRCALLVTPDGVPISIHAERAKRTAEESEGPDAAEDVSALAALATGWTNEVQRATAPLSWGAPQRLVLRAARGTLCIVEAPGALLVVVLESGALPEDLRLPMDATVGRLERHLRSIGAARSRAETKAGLDEPSPIEPPGLFPVRPSDRGEGHEALQVRTVGDRVPESSGE